jgi:hypothetical protein
MSAADRISNILSDCPCKKYGKPVEVQEAEVKKRS